MPENILSLSDKFDAFVFDIYGVVWDGKKIIDGAEEVMAELVKRGKKVVVLSNASQRSYLVEENYAKRHIIKDKHYHSLVTSGELAYQVFSDDSRDLTFYQFGNPVSRLFVDSSYQEIDNWREADFVYIGIPQLKAGGEWLNVLETKPFETELRKMQKADKVLVCANPDLRAFEKSHEEPVIRQGSIAVFYESIGGKVGYFGKPYRSIYEFALGDICVEPERMLMIGDTLATDIKGARDFGMKTALTVTGITSYEMHKAGRNDFVNYVREQEIQPDYILESVSGEILVGQR